MAIIIPRMHTYHIYNGKLFDRRVVAGFDGALCVLSLCFSFCERPLWENTAHTSWTAGQQKGASQRWERRGVRRWGQRERGIAAGVDYIGGVGGRDEK